MKNERRCADEKKNDAWIMALHDQRTAIYVGKTDF